MAVLQDYSIKVHKSLQQPDLLLGVPKVILALLLVVAVLLAYLFGVIFALIGIIFYIPCYFLSKEDPQMLTIALESLFEMEHLEG